MRRTCGGIETALRNKRTGLVHKIIGVECEPGGKWKFASLLNGRRYEYDSMDQLKREWEYPKNDK